MRQRTLACLLLSSAAFSCARAATDTATAPAMEAATESTTNEGSMQADTSTASKYPAARRGDVVDTYHGTSVPDPYRWLEKIDSDEAQKWVGEQVSTTSAYLEQIPERSQIRDMLAKVYNYERYGLPFTRGGRYFVSRNDGLQDQSVWYWMDSIDGEMKVLLDPNTLSKDGTVAISGLSVSDDGKLLAYALSESGSDWKTWRVREIESGRDLPDKVEWGKFSGASWTPDNKGFYYSRFDKPADGEVFSSANYFQKLYYHQLGTSQDQDQLIYERKDQKEWGFYGDVSEDGRYLFINVSLGTDTRNLVFVQDLKKGKTGERETIELIPEFEASYSVIGNRGSKLYVETNESAPRGRVVEIDLRRPEKSKWKEILPQSEDKLASATMTGGKLFVTYLHDAHAIAQVYSIKGKLESDIALPGIGNIYGFGGQQDAKETFYSYTSFTDPGSIYRYEIKTGKSEVYKAPKLSFNPDDFVTKQVFYQSKDGTRVPMFISHRKDLPIDGARPTYLYGYGGFDISLAPSFSPADLVWMQMGGVFAQPNLRGGGEYGEEWHAAGTKQNKQNVFDDFIAAAQWLVESGYTKKEKLAIGGRSNGGLLVGATLTQRPDLFAAALPGVGVLDMLRFPEFTIGRAWVSDYGSPTNVDEFRALYAYSPYHNVVRGTKYPATLVYTADHDDRVFPAHSFKFAAALQFAQSGESPTLIRIETKAGHGAGMPTSKYIDQWADLWGFLVKNLDMKL